MFCIYFLKQLLNGKGLDRKNLSLMPLSLKLKFLYKNLAHTTQSSSSENFCTELMLSIKEYYNLEEIMVIDSIHIEFKPRDISFLKKEVYNFPLGNLISLKEKFKTTDTVVLNTTINNRKYVLYIAELAQGIDCNGFIIYIENFPSLLSKSELLGLESNIKLLKMRLFYN